MEENIKEKEKELTRLMIRHGVTNSEMAEICRCHRTRITHMRNDMKKDGWDGLVEQWTDEEKEKTEKMLREVVEQVIRISINGRGISPEEKKRRRKEKCEQAQVLFAKGMTTREVAKEMGLSYHTVDNWVRFFGIKCESEEVERKKIDPSYADEFHEEWTKAVNRIRKYAGLSLLKNRRKYE